MVSIYASEITISLYAVIYYCYFVYYCLSHSKTVNDCATHHDVIYNITSSYSVYRNCQYDILLSLSILVASACREDDIIYEERECGIKIIRLLCLADIIIIYIVQWYNIVIICVKAVINKRIILLQNIILLL